MGEIVDKERWFTNKWTYKINCEECEGKVNCRRSGKNKRYSLIIVTCKDGFKCPIISSKSCLDCGWSWNGICDKCREHDVIPDEYFINGGHPDWCPYEKE